jgi:rRNA-processing protein FCF1
MEKVMLDTSVYGELIKEVSIANAIIALVPKKYVIYGTKIIRSELRDIAKEARIEGRSKRNLLLQLYDSFVRQDHLQNMINDLRIVACASFHNLDIVVSNDEKSMLSEDALPAYAAVCKEFRLRVPKFILYRKFKEMITHG